MHLPFYVKRERITKKARQRAAVRERLTRPDDDRLLGPAKPVKAPRAVVLYAKGFADDRGDVRSTIVLTVRVGSKPTALLKDMRALCAKLNAVWAAEYGAS